MRWPSMALAIELSQGTADASHIGQDMAPIRACYDAAVPASGPRLPTLSSVRTTVAMVHLGRAGATGEASRVAGLTEIFEAAGATVVDVSLRRDHGVRAADLRSSGVGAVLAGRAVPESMAWSHRSLRRHLIDIGADVVVCGTSPRVSSDPDRWPLAHRARLRRSPVGQLPRSGGHRRLVAVGSGVPAASRYGRSIRTSTAAPWRGGHRGGVERRRCVGPDLGPHHHPTGRRLSWPRTDPRRALPGQALLSAQRRGHPSSGADLARRVAPPAGYEHALGRRPTGALDPRAGRPSRLDRGRRLPRSGRHRRPGARGRRPAPARQRHPDQGAGHRRLRSAAGARPGLAPASPPVSPLGWRTATRSSSPR